MECHKESNFHILQAIIKYIAVYKYECLKLYMLKFIIVQYWFLDKYSNHWISFKFKFELNE